MSAIKTSFLALLLLTACDGNPFTSGAAAPPPPAGGGNGATVVPSEVARDLNDYTYSAGTLRIDMQGVTSSGKLATFKRKAALDLAAGNGNPAYEAYVYQDTGLTRSFLAYVAKNERGNLEAVAAADGGQFNEHNFGGRFMRLTAFTRPTTADAPESGEFSYAGSYVGIFSPGTVTGAGETLAYEPMQVRGAMHVNGDFAHNMVEGQVFDRHLFTQDGTQITSFEIDDGDPLTPNKVIDTSTLQSIVLRETEIDANGQFLGKVQFDGDPGGGIGDYAGAFGGTGGTDVAGVLWLNPIDGQSGIWENGAFNLPRCDMAGSSPLCLSR
jgi:hypothetical protein